jgi:hypothetical protein
MVMVMVLDCALAVDGVLRVCGWQKNAAVEGIAQRRHALPNSGLLRQMHTMVALP